VPVHCRMRAFDRDLIRGGHYGQRSCETAPTGRTHGCTDQQRDVKISLANSEPSTHGTSVWTGRALQVGYDGLEIVGLAHLYSAL
jgi:hypothetical protein